MAKQHTPAKRSLGVPSIRPGRHLSFLPCRRCRRVTPHEEVVRSGAVWVGLTLPILFEDWGFHCYSCGKEWGLAFARDKNWITLSTSLGR